MLRMIK